jgi:hypothetical protein
MPRSTLAASFTTAVIDIQRRFRADGVDLADMRKAGSLELLIGTPFEPHGDNRQTNEWPLTIDRIEHQPIRAIPIPAARPGESRLRYFLDGSQKTLPVFRIGVLPVVTAFAVAGVLERADGDCQMLAETLRLTHAWLIPDHVANPDLDRLRAWLGEHGMEIVDPIPARFCPDGEPTAEYFAIAGNYGAMIAAAQEKAGDLRASLERQILGQWASDQERAGHDGFIVVDGRLGENIPNAVGLVKSLDMQHLAGEEAETLFSLPAGYRTSAFRYVGRQTAGRDSGRSEARTMWYIRFWDASGLDARHSLVRIEAPHDVSDPAEIDRISSWLMAERIPRATQDPRWATLLYPIHFLEEILKRRIAGVLTGWPS